MHQDFVKCKAPLRKDCVKEPQESARPALDATQTSRCQRVQTTTVRADAESASDEPSTVAVKRN
jgi:hypothetical protein